MSRAIDDLNPGFRRMALWIKKNVYDTGSFKNPEESFSRSVLLNAPGCEQLSIKEVEDFIWALFIDSVARRKYEKIIEIYMGAALQLSDDECKEFYEMGALNEDGGLTEDTHLYSLIKSYTGVHLL